MSKYQQKLSIITNFTSNCSMNCAYCVWKCSGNYDKFKNHIWTDEYINNNNFSEKLIAHFQNNKKLLKNFVYSISGGTDPLIAIPSFASMFFIRCSKILIKDFH